MLCKQNLRETISENTARCISHLLGRIQDFTGGGLILGLPMAVPCRGVPPLENFSIQVLGNAISNVLRPSHGVLRSRFFKPKCHSFASKYYKTTLKQSKLCIRIQICIYKTMCKYRYIALTSAVPI